MASATRNPVLRHLRKLAGGNGLSELSDPRLLERFVAQCDEAAFEALIARHGPMVASVCRRVLHDTGAAEDAFQATFLVLARRAASIRDRGLLGNWLYGVAHRTATKARAETARRRAYEAEAPARAASDPLAEMTARELLDALDHELVRLPSRFRAPIVACYLEGLSREEAAAQLRCSTSTLDRRLARGRRLLRARLSGRGLALPAALLPILLSQDTVAAQVQLACESKLVRATTETAFGVAEAASVPENVTALAEGVIKAMFLNKLKVAAMIMVVVALVGAASALLLDTSPVRVAAADRPRAPAPVLQPEPPKTKPADKESPKPRVLKPEGVPFRLAWAPDGKAVALVSMTQGQEEREINGEKRKVTHFNSTLTFWDAAKGELRLSTGEEAKVRIESVAFAPPDGKLAAVAARVGETGVGEAHEIRLVDPVTGTVKKSIKQSETLRTVVFAPDGKTFATGGQYLPTDLKGPFHRTIRLWDAAAGKMVRELKQELEAERLQETGYLDGLRDLAFSPDGKLVASADADWKVRVVEVDTGKVRHTLDGHTSVVLAVAFAPDGKTLVSGGFDQAVKVWDVASGKELRTLRGNEGQVWTVAFAPDGKLLATGGAGKTGGELVLWDTATWEPKKVITPEGGRVTTLSFSPADGKTLAVGTSQVKLWPLGTLLASDGQR